MSQSVSYVAVNLKGGGGGLLLSKRWLVKTRVHLSFILASSSIAGRRE